MPKKSLKKIKEVDSEYLLDKICGLFQDVCKSKGGVEKQTLYIEIHIIRDELLERLRNYDHKTNKI